MRGEDFDIEKLQCYRLIHRAFCVKYGINPADLDLLIYLNPIKLFNRHDFDDGKMIMSWDKKRFYRLKNDGWIKKVYDGKGWNSGHTKYTVSQKTKLMLAKIAKCIDGRDDIPEIRNPQGYKQKILSHSIRKHNAKKYNYE